MQRKIKDSKKSKKKDKSSSKKTQTEKSKVSTYKGERSSSKRRKGLSISVLEKLKSKLESTLQFRIKVVPEDETPKEHLSKEHLERKEGVNLRKGGVHKKHPQQDKHSENKNNSNGSQKLKAAVVEADLHYLPHNKKLWNSSKELQNLVAPATQDKHLRKNKQKSKEMQNYLLPVVEADHHKLAFSKTSSQTSKFNVSLTGKNTEVNSKLYKSKVKNTMPKKTPTLLSITNSSNPVKYGKDRKNKNGSEPSKLSTNKSFHLTTTKNKTSNIKKESHFQVQKMTEDGNKKSKTNQTIQQFVTNPNETDNVEVDIFKKSVVPTPPGYQASQKDDDRLSLEMKSSISGSGSGDYRPQFVQNGGAPKRFLSTKKISTLSADQTTLESDTKNTKKSKDFGKSKIRNNSRNGKSSLNNSAKRKLNTDKLKSRKHLKRKPKKIVNVEAIRVHFEESNDDLSGDDESQEELELIKSDKENLGDSGSRNEIIKAAIG